MVKLEDRFHEQMLALASMLVSPVDLRDSYTGGTARESPNTAIALRSSWA